MLPHFASRPPWAQLSFATFSSPVWDKPSAFCSSACVQGLESSWYGMGWAVAFHLSESIKGPGWFQISLGLLTFAERDWHQRMGPES